MKIALDAMGGDFGPPNLVAGAVMALRDYRQINKLYLVGDSTEIENELGKHQCNDSRIDIVHSTQVVEMSDRAWTVVRRKKDSSVSRAVDLVKRGDADAVVSAGHTGAAVAASSLNFRGNIEGRHLFEDPVEVVVCDGFVGNVILKTSESISVAIFKWLKQELTRSKIHMVGAYLARKAFRVIKDKTNYEEYGGMPLLGVNGICIIAHGASTPLAIKNALRVATESIEQQVNPHIVEEIRRYHETTAPLEPALH